MESFLIQKKAAFMQKAAYLGWRKYKSYSSKEVKPVTKKVYTKRSEVGIISAN